MRGPCAILLMLTAACAGPVAEPERPRRVSQGITGGKIDDGDPAVVALDLGFGGLCSGTLISPRMVLTAEHCTLEAPTWGAAQFATTVGATTRRVAVVDSVAHPRADLRLAKLATPVRDIAPFEINRTPLTSADVAIRHVGFGMDDYPNGQSGTKRQVTLNVIYTSFDEVIFVSQDGGTGVCFGDSGGPGLMRLVPNGPELVVGVASTLYEFPACYGGGIDARVDTHADWIAETTAIWEAETCEGGDGCKPDCDRPDPDCVCAWDGVCDLRCPRFSMDPDCPVGCDRDGVCGGSGCPLVDLDCTPIGITCAKDSDCQGRTCAAQGGKRYCSKGCQSSLDCPEEMYCSGTNHVCFLRPVLGGACGPAQTCREGACVDEICTATCSSSKECKADEKCLAASGAPAVCRKNPPDVTPPQKTGCATVPHGVALLALAFYGRSRRSKRPPVVV